MKDRERGLRHAGESARERFNEQVLFVFAYAIGITIAVWIMTVAYFTQPQAIRGWVFIIASVLAPILSAWFMWRAFRKYRPYLQGAEGERAAGRVLDELKAHGWHVFHDVEPVPDKKRPWNIDHVLVGPAGIFAVETKAWGKPDEKPAPEIVWDGERLLMTRVAGTRPVKGGREAVEQAERNARTLAQELERVTGKRFWVRGVVALPGWFVRKEVPEGARPPVRVTNPKQIVSGLRHWKTRRLSAEDVALAAARLEDMAQRT